MPTLKPGKVIKLKLTAKTRAAKPGLRRVDGRPVTVRGVKVTGPEKDHDDVLVRTTDGSAEDWVSFDDVEPLG